jgi:sialate O-acetylesterase
VNTPDLAKGWDIVRDAQLDLPVHIPNTAVVSAIDLGLCDTVHLDTASQIRLGRRLATVVQRMETMPGLSCSPQMRNVEAVRESQGLGGLRIRCSGVTGVWKPAEHMAGFGIYQTDGKRHPDCWIINASRDPQDGTAIRLLLNKPADSSTIVGYGRGADPYCNVVDEADMPLAAGALPVIVEN